ncbi:helix-turn-helix transcriptional regulator [Streptomyces lavendulae]|uniref:helix-turn-helix transcriptional regulator n=1 Tax=Streptomyces lavendulae TaxID=1914 RepID=UPI003D81ACEC
MRLRDVAATCALTERTVQTIVADLESDGYLQRVRDGRRNRYEISAGAVFRHPAEAGVQVAGLLALLTDAPAAPDPLTPDPDPDPDTEPDPIGPVPPVPVTATDFPASPDTTDFPAYPVPALGAAGTLPPVGSDFPVGRAAPVSPGGSASPVAAGPVGSAATGEVLADGPGRGPVPARPS